MRRDRNPDAACFGSHARVLSGPAEMEVVASGRRSSAVLVGGLYYPLHGLVAGEMAHTAVAIVDAGSGGFADHLYIRSGVDAALEDHACITRSLAGAVTVDTAQIGCGQKSGDELGVWFVGAGFLKEFGNELAEDLVREADALCWWSIRSHIALLCLG